MADPNEIKKWRSYFLGLTTDQNVVDDSKFKSLLSMLDDAKKVGYVDDSFIQKFQTYRQRRVEEVRKTPLRDPASGQQAFKVNPQGKTVPITGADLFAGNRFMPEAGPAGAMQARQERMAGLKAETEADVKRLGAVSEALAPSTVLGNVGMGFQALTEAVRSVPTTARIAASGLTGGLIAPPDLKQVVDTMVQKPISDVMEMTPEQARLEAMKPARAAGLAFGEGLAPTVGGVLGGQLAGVGLAASGLAAGPLAPIAVPLGYFAGSLGGAALFGKLQESMLRNAYGDEAYEKTLKPAFGQAIQESGTAGMAGAFGNILLQGSPVLASGIGTRRTLGLLKAAWQGKPVTLAGTAEELGGASFNAAAAEAAGLIDGAMVPQIIARTGTSKYEKLVSPFLDRVGAASTAAADRFKIFAPQAGTLGGRAKELGSFIQETPGASAYVGDLLGEQFGNLGQSAYDYINAVKESKETGVPINTAEMLANLAFGSLFIGNNKASDLISTAGGKVGSLGLDLAERIPGVGQGVEALRSLYEENNKGVIGDILDRNKDRRSLARQQIDANIPGETQRQFGTRNRIGTPGGQASGPSTPLGPDEAMVPLGDGRVIVFNSQTGDMREESYSSMFGGIDDTATVEQGQSMANALGEAPMERSGRGLDKLTLFGGQDVVAGVGTNRQQVVGLVRTDDDQAHVIVREVYKDGKGEGEGGKTRVRYDVVRAEDLEVANIDPASAMIEAAGLTPSTETPYTVGEGEVDDIFSRIFEWQGAIRENLPHIAKEFPTFVQFGPDQVLQGRIIGSEKNGDVRLQLFSPQMAVVRVAPESILEGTAGGKLEPVSLTDLEEETILSSAMVPKQDGKFDIFDKPEDGLHSLQMDGISYAVALTGEQRNKLARLVQKVRSARDAVALRTNDQRQINAARFKAAKEALLDLFGADGRPTSEKEWEPGSVVKVRTKDGEEFGVVLDNTEMGPLVSLKSRGLKPVVVQDSDVLTDGFDRAKSLEGQSVQDLVVAFRSAKTPEEKAAIATAIASEVEAIAKQVKFDATAYVSGRDIPDAAVKLARIAGELTGRPVEGSTVVSGDIFDVFDQIWNIRTGIQDARSSIEDAIKAIPDDAERQDAIDQVKPVFDLMDNAGTVLSAVIDSINKKLVKGGPSLSAASMTGKDANFYRNQDVEDIYQFAKGLSVKDKANFLLGQMTRLKEDFTDKGDVETAVKLLFGIQEDEGYWSGSRKGVLDTLQKIDNILRDAASRKDSDPAFTDAVRVLLNTDVFPKIEDVVRQLNFGKKPKPKPEPKPTAAVKVPVGATIDEMSAYDLSGSVISETRQMGGGTMAKGRFAVAQLIKVLTGKTQDTAVLTDVLGIPKSTKKDNTWIGTTGTIRGKVNELRSAVDRGQNTDTDQSPENIAKYNQARQLLEEASNWALSNKDTAFEMIDKEVVEKPQPQAKPQRAKIPVGSTIDELGRDTVEKSVYQNRSTFKGQDQGRWVAGQLLKLLGDKTPSLNVLTEVFGFDKSKTEPDTWIGSFTKVKARAEEMKRQLQSARNRDSDASDENLAKYDEAVRLLEEAVKDIDKNVGGLVKFKSKETAKEIAESAGQAEVLAQSPEAQASRRVSQLQAQALNGSTRAVISSADGMRVALFKNRKNLAQQIVRKLFADPEASLTQEEQNVFDALEMPSPKDNREWYRNAFQGVSYLNSNPLRAVLHKVASASFGRGTRPAIDQPLKTVGRPDGEVLSNAEQQVLRNAGYVFPDNTIDVAGIRIYGQGERGFYVGSLFQSVASADPADKSGIEYDEFSDIWSFSLADRVVTFRAIQANDQKQLEDALVAAFRKTTAGKGEGVKKAQARIKAVVDLFDTIIHGASKRKVEMMVEATRAGAFVTRQQEDVFIRSTREQRGDIKVTGVLEAELQPLYTRLRELLGLAPNTSLTSILDSSNEQTRDRVATAIATLVDEVSVDFYQTRIPAIADFDSVPNIAGLAGEFLNIYDPVGEMSAKVIVAYHAADASTFVHEMAHAVFEGLPEELQAELSSTLGHTLRAPTITNPSVLTYEAQEKFAYGLELSLANLASLKDPKSWKGSNLKRGASEKLFKVLQAAGDFVVESYNLLASKRGMAPAQPGENRKEWRIPYTGRQGDAPKGRVYLWRGAPIILHDGSYATVAQDFGTTQSATRRVQIESGGTVFTVATGDIAAIGAPLDGLRASTMQVLSVWISERSKVKGLVESTPQGRAEQIIRDSSGRIVGVQATEQWLPKGEITNANINQLLAALNLQSSTDDMLSVLRKSLSAEDLRYLVEQIAKINQMRPTAKAKVVFQQANYLSFLHAYTNARILGKLDRAVRDLNEADARHKRAKNAIAASKDPNRNHPFYGKYWEAVRQAERVIYATREIIADTQNEVKQVADGNNKNWTLDRVDQKKEIAYLTRRVAKDKRKREYWEQKVSVNMRTGETRLISGPNLSETSINNLPLEAQIVKDSPAYQIQAALYPTMLQIKGGTIAEINRDAKAAFDEIGIGGFGLRVPTKEFLIAKVLMDKAAKEGREIIPVGDIILQQYSAPLDYGLPTSVAQFDLGTLNRVVKPELAFPDEAETGGFGAVDTAIRLGDVSAAMQSTGQIVTSMNEQARAAQDQWVADTLNFLGSKAYDALDEKLKDWRKNNPGKEPKIYIYDAYVTMPLSNAETGEPLYLTGIELEEALAKRKKGDDSTPVQTGRVKTQILALEPLKGLGQQRSVVYYDSDQVAVDDEFAALTDNNVMRLDIRDFWIDTNSGKVIADFARNPVAAEKKLRKEIGSTLAATNNRVRDVAKKWPSQYNPATEAQSAVDPNQAWKPMRLGMSIRESTTTLPDGRKVGVVAPYPKVEAEAYALDVTAGDTAWVAAKPLEQMKWTVDGKEKNVAPLGTPLSEIQNQLVARYNDLQSNNKGLHPYLVSVLSVDGKEVRYQYHMAFRTDSLDVVVETDTNKGRGFASEAEAKAEAEKEHLRLRGLLREKQEEEVARRVASEFIDIIKIVQGIGSKTQDQLTAEEVNAVNILKQFTWYKAMEDRLVGTYGAFASYMADLLGATSPQTPVWQNYYATMYTMHGGVGTYARRVALTPEIVERNAALAKQFLGKGNVVDAKGAMVVVRADHRRTLRIWRLHAGLVQRFGEGIKKSLSATPVNLTIDNYQQLMADVFAEPGGEDAGKTWVELFHEEVPDPKKRAEVLRQFSEYMTKDDTKKDNQFRSFVSVVDDWAEPTGEVVRYNGKRKMDEVIGKIPAGTKLPLAQTVIPRNYVTGALFGSNSQNVIQALANEWLTVAEDMPAKARNFAMNMIGLSKGATIDVWAARLTRRHLNEHFMGVKSRRQRGEDGRMRWNTEIVDDAKYEAWSELPEAQRKQFFRLAPSQERAVQGGYVANLVDAVATNGYVGGTGREEVTLVGPDKTNIDVRNARISGEFGAANRIFAKASQKVNAYLEQPGYMSPADLQAVVWFAEKELWVQNGWTSAAGAGGSFEQMYAEFVERSGGLSRGTMSVRLRDGGMRLTNEEKVSLMEVMSHPFDRERQYQEGVGDVQRVLQYPEQKELVLPAPRYPAMTANVLSRRAFNQSSEYRVGGQISLTAMMAQGRDAFDEDYKGDIPTVGVSKELIGKIAQAMSGQEAVEIPVGDMTEREAEFARQDFLSRAKDQRTVFVTQYDNAVRFVGSAVVQNVELSGEPGNRSLKITFRKEQFMVNSASFMHGKNGLDKDNFYGSKPPRASLKQFAMVYDPVAQKIAEDGFFFGTIPVESIPKANGAVKDTVLPRQPRIAAVQRASMAPFVESAVNVLATVRDATDAFVSRIATVTPETAQVFTGSKIGTVPPADAYIDVREKIPDSNYRYGFFLQLEAPVGGQRANVQESSEIFNRIEKIVSRLLDELPNLGYEIKIDGHASDLYSDITGTKGAPIVEVVWSPEQFIRNYQPLQEIGGEKPKNAESYEAIYTAYITGDAVAMRVYESQFVTDARLLIDKINTSPETAGGIVLQNESVYQSMTIPQESVNARKGSLRELAQEEHDFHWNQDGGISAVVSRFAVKTGRTSNAEVPDTLYVGNEEPRIARPSDVLDDPNGTGTNPLDAGLPTSMAQVQPPLRPAVGLGRRAPGRINLVASALAGTSRTGFDTVYQSALEDYRAGRRAVFQKKMNFIASVAGETMENAFSDMDVQWHMDLSAGVIAGDAKPTVTGSMFVTEDTFARVVGRAIQAAKSLAQPNVFITQPAEGKRFGINSDGSMVVPTIKIRLNRALDPVELRALVDSNPSVFNGVNQTVDQRTLEIFMVPDGNFGRAEARKWTAEATQFIQDFFGQDVGMVTVPDSKFGSLFDAQRLAPGLYKRTSAAFGERAKKRLFPAVDGKTFSDAINAVKDVVVNGQRIRDTVHIYTPEEFAQMRTFLSPDQKTGYAIKTQPDGAQELVAVFNAGQGGRVGDMLFEAIGMEGAEQLDAFDQNGFLPNIYRRFGFEVDSVMAWDDAYMPEGWDKEKQGTPNVVFMKVVPEVRQYVEEVTRTQGRRGGTGAVPLQAGGRTKAQGLPRRLSNGMGSGFADAVRAGQEQGEGVGRADTEAAGPVEAVTEGAIHLWNFGSSELGGKGSFSEYDAILDLVRSVAPNDSIPSPEKVTFRTNQRLRREMEFTLSTITGKDVKLPQRVKFRRTPAHTSFQIQLARHHDQMPLNALESDPYVRRGYDALVKELDQQYRALNLTFEFMPYKYDDNGKIVKDEEGWEQFDDPYQTLSEVAIRDMQENRHLYIYPTTPSSFGDESANFKDHPLLEQSPFKTADGKPMLWNDVLRGVHDAIAHGLYGASFGKDGEELAFATHALVTQDPWAIMALNSETRLQNSWYHFNSNRIDANGQQIPGSPERYSDQKAALPSIQACYTGLNQVDDRLRLFAQKLKTEFDGYNGTVEYLAKKEGRTPEGTIEFNGNTDAFSAFDGQVVVVNTKKHGDKVVVDLQNGVVQADLSKFGDAVGLAGDMVGTVFDGLDSTLRETIEQFNDTPTRMAQITGPTSPAPGAPTAAGPANKPNPLLRSVFFLNQLLRGGASGDVSPILMQNFLNANLLENPGMVIRQFRLLGQVMANPNLGIQLKDGTVVNMNGMRGRRMFDKVLDSDVRSKSHYDEGKNAGLDLASYKREQALEELRTVGVPSKGIAPNPSATYDDVDELGYDIEVTSDTEFLKHMPGQGLSERFFTLSKDVVKANQWENMVDTLIQLGYNPTPWQYDADGNLKQTQWTRALQDLASLINIASGDAKFAPVDETDEMMARVGKLMFFAPRWLGSRLLLNEAGRGLIRLAGKASPKGQEWIDSFLAVNRMSEQRLRNRSRHIAAMHGRLMYKAYLGWLGLIMAIYAMRATNPHTMEVSIEDMGTRFKIGDYSFKAPGGIMAPVELVAAVMGASEARAVKPGGEQKGNAEMVWESVGKFFLSRTSPIISAGAEVLTGRDAFGEPAFIPDEAASRFYGEVIHPMFGAGDPPDVKINKALSKRLIWWWLNDMAKVYDTERSAMVVQSDALIKASMIAAYTAMGGRINYFPKEQMWKRDAAKRLESTPELSQFLTGAAAQPINMGAYDADTSGQIGEAPVPFIGAISGYEDPVTGVEPYDSATGG
jgi:hypothetical protein